MKTYNVLILGSGGREHALIKAIKHSPILNQLYITSTDSILATEAIGTSIDPLNREALETFVGTHQIDLIIPGSEIYLEKGVANWFEHTHTKVFGPKKQEAMIETSKHFAKALMAKYGIATASFQVFSDFELAKAYVMKQDVPIVIKYDGLAAGKGVTGAFTMREAIDALNDMLNNHLYGHAKVIIEDYLDGLEFSYIVMVNGDQVIPLPVSKDYKRLNDHNLGPNTGGMGAVSPVGFVTPDVEQQVLAHIIEPTVKGFLKEGLYYQGFLYAGLILTKDGPKVIEFNARLGDPESEVILSKISSDLLTTMVKLLNGEIEPLIFDHNVHLGVVMASKGYPLAYQKGILLSHDLSSDDDLHMGLKKTAHGYITNGGRVLFVKAQAPSVKEARKRAYKKVELIANDSLVYRHDIGEDVI